MQGLKINKEMRKHSTTIISIVLLITFVYTVLLSSVETTIETPTGLGTGETLEGMVSLCGLTITTDRNLLADINCTNDGITLDADNITLNCQGNTIEYGWNGSVGYNAVTATSNTKNITVKNCVLKEGNTTGTAEPAIYLFRIDNSTITNNTIITKRTSSYGIQLESGSEDNNITNNNINTTGTSSYGIQINNGPDRNYVANNNITTSGGTGHGINLEPAINNNQFINNTIKTIGGGSGIYFGLLTNTNYFYNNTITTSTTVGPAFYLYAQNQEVKDNSIVSAAYGFYMISNTINNIISGNKVNTTGTGIDAFWMQSTKNNIITNNVINASGTSAHGFYLYAGSSNNTIANNTIVESGSDSIRMDKALGYPENNTIENNDLGMTGGYHLNIRHAGINGTILKNQEVNKYSFNDNLITIEKLQGKIKYLTPIEGVGNNLSYDISISANLVSVNSSQSGLNASANITLYKIIGDWPTYAAKNNEQCTSNTCGTLTNESDTYYFNVSGFNESTYTNYSIHFNYCNQNITESLTLENDINCEQSKGLSINSSNLIIDCNNYILNGNRSRSDYGIVSIDNSNLTINDCMMTNFYYGFFILTNTIENITLVNNTIYNNTHTGIYVSGKNAIVQSNNVTGNTGRGIAFSQVSQGLLKDNICSGQSTGIRLSAVNNSNIVNNTCKNNSNHGIDMIGSGIHNNTFLNNKLINNTNGSMFSSELTGDDILIYNNTYGEIKWLPHNNLTFVPELYFGKPIEISDNNIYFNSTNHSLNRTANLTFRNISLTGTLKTLRNNQDCPSSICGSLINVSTTYYFNVTGFTNYSIGIVTPSSEPSGGSSTSTSSTTVTTNVTNITETVDEEIIIEQITEEEIEEKELSMQAVLDSETVLEKVRFKIILETPEIKGATLEYSIITSTGTILVTEEEEIIIENKTLEKEIKLPENIAPAEYKLIIILKTGEEIISKELVFNLGSTEQPTFFGTEKESYYLYIIIFFILILIVLAIFEIFPGKKPE